MEKSRALKIYFLPFLAPGHMIPLVQLARLVGSRGQQVTIITTPSNAKIYDKTISEEEEDNQNIRFHMIKVGLPEGVENLFAVVKRLMDGGEEGTLIRSKAKEMQQKAWKAVQQGGSSHNTLTALLHHLNTLVPKPPN